MRDSKYHKGDKVYLTSIEHSLFGAPARVMNTIHHAWGVHIWTYDIIFEDGLIIPGLIDTDISWKEPGVARL